MRISGIAIASLLVCAPLLAGDQGFIITSAFTLDRGKPVVMTNYLSADHARWSSSAGDLLVDARSGQMITIDSDSKTYYVTTLEDLRAATAALKKQTKAAAVALTVDVKKAGASRKIAGYDCESWIVTFGSMSRSEECIATDPNLASPALDLYRSYSDAMREMSASVSGMSVDSQAMREQLKKLKGLPLSSKGTMSVMGQQTTSSTEVTDIKRAEIPASTWEVPAGYKKVDNPMREAMGLKK
jgi:hypothetical protein